MSDTALAVIFSLGTAFSSATFSLLVRRGQQYGNAVTGVLIGLIVSSPVLVLLAAVFWDPSWWNPRAVSFFIAAGLAGSAAGRVFLYLGIHRLGVARSMPMISTTPLFSALLAYGFLGERPGPFIWVGTFLVVGGCGSLTLKKKGDLTWDRRFLWVPFVAVVGFSISNAVRKAGISLVPSPLFAAMVTSVSSLFFMAALFRFLPETHRPDLRWGKAWYFYGACGLVNSFAFLVSFYALIYGDLTIVSPLTSTVPVFSLLLSWFFLRDLERVTGLIVAGTLLTVLGAALIAWQIL